MTIENKVDPTIACGIFQCNDISRCFNHTDHPPIPLPGGTKRTLPPLGIHPAAITESNMFEGLKQRLRQLAGEFALTR